MRTSLRPPSRTSLPTRPTCTSSRRPRQHRRCPHRSARSPLPIVAETAPAYLVDRNIGAAIAQILMILSRAARLSDGISLPSRRAAYLAGPPQAMGAADTTASSDHSPESVDASESFEAPCPRKGDIPPEIMQLERVLNRYVRTLPAAYIDQNSIALAVEDNGLIAPPKSGLVRSLLVLLQSQILLSFALLHEEQARYDHALYWPKCVIASRSIVQLSKPLWRISPPPIALC
jgi:hypothetical protein